MGGFLCRQLGSSQGLELYQALVSPDSKPSAKIPEPQFAKRKLQTWVTQVKLVVVGMYSVVAQKVQPSTGSTLTEA